MITEHILFYPHKEYDIKNELTDNLRCSDYVQYGYIKKRDLTKWENDEVISVKMGMLTPSKNGYRGKTILQSAIQRIMEQDSTSCFDDEDELIPVYIFVSKETDNEWREYLKENGFVSSRKNANREGIKINKTNIGLHYGQHYGIETNEILSKKEAIEKEKKEIIEKKRKYFESLKNDYETKYYRSYETDITKQKNKIEELKNDNRYIDVSLDEKTLDIKAFKCSSAYVNKEDIIGGILSVCIIIMIIFGCTLYSTPDFLINSDCEFSLYFHLILFGFIISILVFGYIIAGGEIKLPLGKWVVINVNDEEIPIDCDITPSIGNRYTYKIFMD